MKGMLIGIRMNKSRIRVTCIDDSGDMRGSFFQLPGGCLQFLEAAIDFSIMTLKPAHVRGNHFHQYTKEVLVIVHQDCWSLLWDTGEKTRKYRRRFYGKGVEMIEIEPLCSHAVRNNGSQDLYIIHIRDKQYNPENPDVVPRPVVV